MASLIELLTEHLKHASLGNPELQRIIKETYISTIILELFSSLGSMQRRIVLKHLQEAPEPPCTHGALEAKDCPYCKPSGYPRLSPLP